MVTIKLSEPQANQSHFALFDLGFRPFFLAAGLIAILFQPLWLAIYSGNIGASNYYGAVGWHAHEMLFGYSAAVIAGFLLTAARNWTGKATLSGTPLLLFVLLWCLGRFAALTDIPPALMAAIDFLFLPTLAVSLLIPILKTKQWRNIIFPLLIILMAIANGLVHAQALGWSSSSASSGLTLALYTILIIIVIMAGRVVPFFIEKGAKEAEVNRWPIIERLSIASIVLLALSELLTPFLSPWVALLAFIVHCFRWAGWVSSNAMKVPLLWVLIGGYFWLVVGLLLMFFHGLSDIPKSLAIHAFTVGCIGVLTVGMMARVSLGHTGRLLKPHRFTVWAFALINLAVFVRVIMPITELIDYTSNLVLATLLWSSAFILFIIIYTPILLRPRADEPPPPRKT